MHTRTRTNRKGVLTSYLDLLFCVEVCPRNFKLNCSGLRLVADTLLNTCKRTTRTQAILTPNNAGMFRGRAGGHGREKGHRQILSELSSNTTTDDEGDGDDPEKGKQQGLSRDPTFKNGAAGAARVSPFAPKRRMTFGGIRSDKRGEVYQAQRRPSFLEGVGRRAAGAAETAAKVARRFSFQGNTELVAVAVRLRWGLG